MKRAYCQDVQELGFRNRGSVHVKGTCYAFTTDESLLSEPPKYFPVNY